MPDDWEDFYRKERFRSERKAEEREENREFKREDRELSEKQKKEARRFQEERDNKHFEHQENIANLNNRERRIMNQERLVNTRDLAIRKQENSVLSAEVQATGTLEAERERTKREVQIRKFDIEAKARFLKIEQDFNRESRELDFEDEVKRTDLRCQEYGYLRSIDRQNQRALHQDHLETLREQLKHTLIEKKHAQRLEKDRMTHETNEKMRYTRFLMEIKREFGELSKEELDSILEIWGEEWKKEDESNF